MIKRLLNWLQYEDNFWPVVGIVGIAWLLLGALFTTGPSAKVLAKADAPPCAQARAETLRPETPERKAAARRAKLSKARTLLALGD